VRRPYDVRDPHAFAVEITGESMAPRYEQGDIVVCSPEKRWKSGDYCVVITADGESLASQESPRARRSPDPFQSDTLPTKRRGGRRPPLRTCSEAV
jgi:hypothetical protein